jgi:transcription elongation factor Elf1
MSERENCTTCGAEYEVTYDTTAASSDQIVHCNQCGATLQPKPSQGKPAYRLIQGGSTASN